MSVWDALVGQGPVVDTLQRAISGQAHAMTHAWLFTGPAGSGRSVAASAFAAGLQCAQGGCGVCQACLTARAGTHPDVTVVRTEQLSIGVDEVRDLVRRAAMSPTLGRWQTLIIEDADRMTERGADALLKAIEEPADRTVWMLCAPTADDVVVTVRSRSRHVGLVTPSQAAVVQLLTGEGVAPDQAEFAARVSQGHIGRARALATKPEAAQRRRDILALPAQLTGLGPCLKAAAWAVTTAQAEAQAATAPLDAAEQDKLAAVLATSSGKAARGMAGQMKDLEEQQALRLKRFVRDRLDSVLGELTSYYRDVLVVQMSAQAGLVNQDCGPSIREVAQTTTAEATIGRIDAIVECRRAMMSNVAPQLAFEALMVSLA
ncbi:MAG: DNA polymerase III subunit delta' [Propionibacteriaceae bacterium]|jgi:DNA polymerase-3 subunit delta'|nr:DNA polymerase III subunit delta' [Propionibacteriaceae bacterium]